RHDTGPFERRVWEMAWRPRRLRTGGGSAFQGGGGTRGVPDTPRKVLMIPKRALNAPRQSKPLETHDLGTSARSHHAAWWRGGVVRSQPPSPEAVDDAVLARTARDVDATVGFLPAAYCARGTHG